MRPSHTAVSTHVWVCVFVFVFMHADSPFKVLTKNKAMLVFYRNSKHLWLRPP